MINVIYLRRAWRDIRIEWRHTFLSARREYPTRTAARMFIRDLAKRLMQVRHP